MEQWILRQFNAQRHPANREVLTPVTYDSLEAAWPNCLVQHRRTGR
jgi:hypothetical protein